MMTRAFLPALLALVLCSLGTIACAPREETEAVDNPFFSEFETPFGAPPFESIREEHYLPASDRGVEEQQAEIEAIVTNPGAPTFANTIEALERSGAMLTRMRSVLFPLNSANTNDEMQAIVKEMQPKFSQHRDDILLNEELFTRVKVVYEEQDLDLTVEESMLLEETYQNFVRNGANLDPEAKAELRELNQELSVLTVQFGENLLEEMNAAALILEDEADLAGLPEGVRAAAARNATEQGHEGKWVFTLQRTSWTPFLTYSERRDLREELYGAYTNLCNHGNETDNKELAAKIATRRARRAALLGYPTHAHYVLERNMAETPDNVNDLLAKLWAPALARAKSEAAEAQQLINDEGGDFDFAAWDWWYYAEKIRQRKYDFDAETLKPYFVLDNVRAGVFDVANQLFGLTFERRTDVPVYHEDVEAYEVKDADGTLLALYYVDYFTRPSKRGGAWMNNFREQSKENGEQIRPIISNVANFTKPGGDQPALLTLDETRTLFHEFGHALHGLLADSTYESLSGTNVRRDFVELPSQMMENWAMDPGVLKSYAKHFETGEPIPDELIEKLQAADKFNQGFATTEYLAASILDMDWHSIIGEVEPDSPEFEAATVGRIGLIPEVVSRYRSTYFSHIFAGGYAAGYYSYIWAEVLDADAFEAFKEKGIFDQELARSYRENLLERGGSEPPMALYLRFRGAEPTIEPLLERRGLVPEGTG
ncbi:MAG: M3 family metallopeptidase [Thermoanaerobaculia bacterium]